MNATLSRRSLLAATAASAFALAACDRKPHVTYNGINLTGATYATDFQLSDTQGQQRRLADFRGKVVLVFFGFTQCPDICPTALARAAEVKRLLGADGERFQTLFITIDPERDTPAVLRAYTEAFDESFIGLYGDLARTQHTANDFKVFYKKVPTGASYTMDHSSLSYVYDPQGRLRLALRHAQSPEEYAQDLRKLLHSTPT